MLYARWLRLVENLASDINVGKLMTVGYLWCNTDWMRGQKEKKLFDPSYYESY